MRAIPSLAGPLRRTCRYAEDPMDRTRSRTQLRSWPWLSGPAFQHAPEACALPRRAMRAPTPRVRAAVRSDLEVDRASFGGFYLKPFERGRKLGSRQGLNQ